MCTSPDHKPSRLHLTDSVVDAIVIGRNEGERLVVCLDSLHSGFRRVIYVDSGSSDESVNVAQTLGAEVVELDISTPFTAARARNAGLAQLANDPPDYVQFLDGDCELVAGWADTARRFLQTHPTVAVVCGRRRERSPEASVYNRLIDLEWDTPVGQALACGGDAMMRYQPLLDVRGYRDELIAGEEPELCVRLRKSGWDVWRLDAEMTLHDANLHRFSQWFARARRAGHAFAEGAVLHGAPPERHWIKETRRAMLWGAALPVIILMLVFVSPWFLLLCAIYPAQIIRQIRHGTSPTQARFNLLAKFPEALGVLTYWTRRITRRKAVLIEYK